MKARFTPMIWALVLQLAVIFVGFQEGRPTMARTWAAAEEEVQRPEGWSEETHGDEAEADYDVVFQEGAVKRLDFVIAPEDWQAMLDDMTDRLGGFGGNIPPSGTPGSPRPPGPRDADAGEVVDNPGSEPIYRPCTLAFEGKTWWYVGVRFKGNSSLRDTWRRGVWKLPFRLDIDEFEDDHPEITNQRFYGFKELSLSSNFHDTSLLREKMAADIFRDAGVAAPHTAFYRLYIDHGEGPIYFGLYTLVEVVDNPMLDDQFGDTGGNLYKPEGVGAQFVTFDPESFVKKSNEEEADWSDVIAVFEALHAGGLSQAQWRAGLEGVFDVEGFLRWLAVNIVIQNWDTYGIMWHNYYLYGDANDGGRLHWIPWDNNEALDAKRRTPLSLYLSPAEVGDDWPLIRYLIDDSHYRGLYGAFVNEVITGVFSVSAMQKRYQEAHDLIEPYVVGDEGEQPGYTFLRDDADFYTEFDYLFNHVGERGDAALEFLAGEHFTPIPLVINEIHYNPSPDQGDDGDYEFIELYNAGFSEIDLSGYFLAGGIEFTFPPGTVILPGEFLIVACNGETYQHLDCQVFQWDDGQLANGGEAIQLKDAASIQIDYVIYDDDAPWPAAPDGNGASLELLDSSRSNALAENWAASSVAGGTPGAINSTEEILIE